MKLIHLTIVFLMVGMVLLAPRANASVVKNIYVASVPVANQSAAARAKALRAALVAVVVKVTGSKSATSAPGLTDFLAHSERALQRYSYARIQPVVMPGRQARSPRQRARPALHLRAKFDSTSVNQALRGAGLPIWGRERPVTLVWLAKQGEAARTILSADTSVALETFLKRRARQRGVAIEFPLMDLQDQNRVSFSDIAGGFIGHIRKASARYHPDGILIGHLQSLGAGEWRAQWQLLIGGDTSTWKTPPGPLAKVSAAGIRGSARYYAQHFALRSDHGGARGVEVDVSGIQTVAAYARVLGFLKSLTPVQSLQVERVSGAKVVFRIDARGRLANLRDAINLGDLLQSRAARPAKRRAGAPASQNHPPAKRGASSRGGARGPVGAVLRYHYTP